MKQEQEKLAGGEIVIQNRFLRWLDNFWYHYKWPTLIVAFFLLVGLICFTQCIGGEDTDLTVAYAGGAVLSGEEQLAVGDVLGMLLATEEMPGGKSLALHTFPIYDEEQTRALSTDEEGVFSPYAFNSLKQASADNLGQMSSFVKTGEGAIWLVSPYVYETLSLSARAVPLSELFESEPEAAYDSHAIRLADTELYRYYDILKCLPEDTLVLLPRALVVGESSDAESYATFEALFCAIVEFRQP